MSQCRRDADLSARAVFAARAKIDAAARAARSGLPREERREMALSYIYSLMFPLDDLLILQGREWLACGVPDPLDFLDRR
ncbi:MAG: hypothetical protein M0Z99_21135 [Betaproteobacteria bacterium]|nr:hypothetical protein [Betaproteobacteria bacterium]